MNLHKLSTLMMEYLFAAASGVLPTHVYVYYIELAAIIRNKTIVNIAEESDK